MLKRLGFSLLLLLGSLIFMLGFLEVGLRLLLPIYDPSGGLTFHYPDENVPLGPPGHTSRHDKNTGDFDVQVTLNEAGLRDVKPLSSAKAEDLFVVGDSYSMGWGIEEDERYSNALDALVAVQVFNISIPTDINGYLRRVDYAIEQRAPIRRLIVGICMENELLDYAVLAGLPDRPKPLSGLSDVKGLLTGHSALYLMFTTWVHQNPAIREIAIEVGLIRDNLAVIRKNAVSDLRIAQATERVSTRVDGFQATLLLIPSRGLWVGANQAEEAEVHDRFVASLRGAGQDVVDMRTVFERAGDPMSFHFEGDGHWHLGGHRVAAQALVDHLPDRSSLGGR